MNAKKPKISKKRLAIFSVFVLISAVFWFLSAMNREYTTKLDYKIEFIDFPDDVRPASAVPEKLLLTVKGFGYDLIGLSNNTNPLKISIKEYAIKDKNDKSKLIIYTHLLSDKFFPEASGIEILSVDPETVVFKVEKLAAKKVPVKADIDFSFQPLYMQSDKLVLTPDSVVISGTEKKIKNIKYAETDKLKFSDLKDSLKKSVSLKKISDVRFSENTVKLLLPVEKYTENTTEVNLQVKNCPDTLQLITFPDKIRITYKVVLSRFSFVKEEDFEPYVDYNDISENKTEKLKVYISKYPEFLNSLQISPEFVEYIIEKKN